ncbi:phosphoglycerate mutase family protein-like protein [Dothidotthia symphoricarpi CBS 119687]|uniref:Phosphoglycerate mutase family protein-like protein n=1 Tax=Dothidotthia symphoricarpi CBS 119687 TaxID=1392245 RepID=A0A6A6AHA5_9PLEO|nr:phosphoglycerate mutase family protein-like protein [Dothidotthia symphoricarpi CBS 119687]KAF2131190.1 phosphoglycerate mutase family protein-like protein [Dothidotthia symphoricarpi CBS 119687]
MPDPRVFIIRHGETEWSLNGRHTGTSDIPLTPSGEKRICATGKALVGDDRLIVPGNIAHIYVSPRTRAQRTLALLDLGCHATMTARTQTTDAIREWDYGNYEGLTSSQIRASRSERNMHPEWDIWRDGCEGGESPADITRRLDELIADIRARFHEGRFGKDAGWKGRDGQPNDVLIVAHGHILRSFAARWVGKSLEDNPSLILEAGGVGTLSYEHGRVEEPAILLGGAFVVEVVKKPEEEK